MRTIRVCCGTGCLANGSAGVAAEFERLAAGTGVQVECHVKRTGCNGFCENGPLVTILPDAISYYRVKVEDVPEILERTVARGELVERLLYKNDKGERVRSQDENPFYAPQKKIALRNIGKIEPANVDDYLASGGYAALKKALAMTGEITLRGKVLPVGGIREKILAAKRAGIKEIILCRENKKDIDEIKKEYVKGIKFHFVDHIREVLEIALI